MKRKISSFLLVMIWGLQAQAQDSLYNLYLTTESELEKSSISYQLGKSFYNKELLDSSLYYFQRPLEFEFDEKDGLLLQGHSAFWLGMVNSELNRYSESISRYKEAIQFYNRLNEHFRVGQCYWANGKNFALLNLNKESEDCFIFAQAKFTESNWPQNTYSFYYDWGYNCWVNGRNEEALYFFNKATSFNEEPEFISKVLNLRGDVFRKLDRYDLSKNEFHHAIRKAKQHSSVPTLGWPLNNLGLLYLQIGNLDSALFYFDMAIEVTRGFSYPLLEGTSRTNKAYSYFETADYSSALEELTKALELTKQVENQSEYLRGLELGIRLTNLLRIDSLHSIWLNDLIISQISKYEYDIELNQQREQAELSRLLIEQEKEELERALSKDEPFWNLNFIAGLISLVALGAVLMLLESRKREQALTQQIADYKAQSQQDRIQRDQTESQAAYYRSVEARRVAGILGGTVEANQDLDQFLDAN